MRRGSFRGIERPPWWAVVVMVAGAVFLAVGFPIAMHRGGEPLSQQDIRRMDAAAASASAAEASAQPIAAPVAAFFGDSITYGQGRDNPTDPRAADVAAKDLGWVADVFGHPGTGYVNDAKTQKTFPDQLPLDLGKRTYDVVVIEGSSNDSNVSDAVLTAAVEKTITEAKSLQPTAAIVLLGPYTTSADNMMVQNRRVLAAEAQKFGLPFIDSIEKGWMLDMQQYIVPDGYHPNSAGHVHLGHLWADALRQVVPSDLLPDASATATPGS